MSSNPAGDFRIFTFPKIYLTYFLLNILKFENYNSVKVFNQLHLQNYLHASQNIFILRDPSFVVSLSVDVTWTGGTVVSVVFVLVSKEMSLHIMISQTLYSNIEFL